jgi:hypothetical protein
MGICSNTTNYFQQPGLSRAFKESGRRRPGGAAAEFGKPEKAVYKNLRIR